MSNYTHKRTDSGLEPIYKALKNTFEDLIKEKFFEKNGIVFKVIDHSEKLPKELEGAAKELSQLTKNGKNGEVTTLLGYSLEQDINEALSQDPKDYESFRGKLIFPDIDLVIRPYEMRLSGGPVYAISQAQMIILNKLNPEVKGEDLKRILQEYYQLKNNRINKSHNPHHSKNL